MKTGKQLKTAIAAITILAMATTLFIINIRPNTVNAEVTYNALEYKITFNEDLSAASDPLVDVRSINGFGVFAGIKVNAGDKLVYDVYIPADGNYVSGMGAIDGQYNVNWGFIRATNPKDAEGKNLYTDLAADYGVNMWITRELPITAANEGLAHIGPGSIITKADSLALAGETVILYYKNIKIVHADNTIGNIYVDGGFTSNGQMESTINGTLGTVSLSEVTLEDVEAPATYNALEYEIAFNEDLSAAPESLVDVRSINGYGAFAGIKVNAGDKLVYDVYIPADGNYVFGMGAIDGQYNVNWGFIRTTNPKDDEEIDLYSDLATDYGVDMWITRVLAITSANEGLAHIGPSSIITKADALTLAGKTVILYYKNIKILHADNTISNIYVDGGFTANGQMESTINGTLGTVSLSEVTLQDVEVPGTPTGTPAVTPTNVPNVTTTPTATPSAAVSISPTSTEVVPPTEKCLSYKIDWKASMANPIAPMFDWRNINGAGAFVESILTAGDKLIYDVYIPANGNYIAGMGGLDYQSAISWRTFRFFDGEQFDSNGNSLFSDLVAEYGLNQWITREFTLSANLADGNGVQHIGPATLIAADDYTKVLGLAGKTSVLYYKNIRIKHADGSVSMIFDGSKKLTSSEVVETHFQNYASVTLATINLTNSVSNGGNVQTSDSVNTNNILFIAISAAAILLFILEKRKQTKVNMSTETKN